MNIFLTILLILLAVFALLAGVCFFVKLRIKITISKKTCEKLKLSVILETAGGLISKNLTGSAKKKSSAKAPPESCKNAEQDNISTRQKISSYYQTFCKVKYILSASRHKFRKNILIEKLWLNVEFGLDDAAHTGIATGSIWAGIYNVIALISSVARLNEPEILVNPDFENEKLAFDGECIIVLRLANIINILFVTGISYLTFKNKEKAAINYGNTD